MRNSSDIEAPAEDPGQHRTRELVLGRVAREPQADRGVADQPDREHADSIEQRQQDEVRDRAQALFRQGARRKRDAQPPEAPAQRLLGEDRRDRDEAEQQKECDRAPSAALALVEQSRDGGELPAERRNRAGGLACVREESAECVRAFRGGRLGGLGWCGDAVGLELFGHGLADGIDQAVELLLRHAGRRRRGRLGVHCNHGGKQKADRQRNRTKGGHENSSFAAGLRPGGRRWEAPPFGADYCFILILPLHKGSGFHDMGQSA